MKQLLLSVAALAAFLLPSPARAVARRTHGVHTSFLRSGMTGRRQASSLPAPVPASSSPDPGSSTTSQLPPTGPTVLRQPPTINAVPPLPAPLPQSKATQKLPLATATTAGQALSPSPGTAPPGASASGQLAPPSTLSQRVANLPGPLSSLPIGITASPNEVRISGLGSSSAPWTIVLLLTLLTLIPSLLICVTPFARLLVVFHFLRQALGLQTTPSNQTLIGLTLILTFFIMEPVGNQIYQQALVPLQNGQITPFEALARGKEPMRDFMAHFVREKDAALFLEMAKEPRPRDLHDLSMRVLVPAYIVSELKSGFQIGAVLFLPFLVVDIVVASITTSVGMMQLPPVVISTPLKLLLFLMVDGWHLLIGALVRSFN